MPFIIVRDDLTKMHVNAIVNTTNVKLLKGNGGVSGTVFKAAGIDLLKTACNQIGGCDLGNAVITPGFKLPASHIIHTPSMVWVDGYHGEENILRSCYKACLSIAASKGFESIAFPLIGSGAHGYPKQLAFAVATQEINRFLLAYEGDMIVYLAVFGHRAYRLSKKLASDVHEYISDQYVDVIESRRRPLTDTNNLMDTCSHLKATSPNVNDHPYALSFAQTMIRYIYEHDMTEPEVYNRANITKQNYYKIKMEKSSPKKTTVLALCIAMMLDLEKTTYFLKLAGYAFSPASEPDRIVQSLILSGQLNVININCILFDKGYDNYQLGSAEK